MIIGKIAGTVVCTRKAEKLEGFKLLVVQKYTVDMKPTSDFVVAVDAVGAGANETVLVVSGSSARQTKVTEGRPVDATIVGIVDTIELKKSQ